MKRLFLIPFLSIALFSCTGGGSNATTTTPQEDSTENNRIDRFADLQVLQYKVPGFDKLTDQQKELVYYLSEAALSGRDILYAQNYEHNIQIRRTLEQIYEHFEGDRELVRELTVAHALQGALERI